MDKRTHSRAREMLQNYRDGGMSHVRNMNPSNNDTPGLFNFLKEIADENAELWNILNKNGLNPHRPGAAEVAATTASGSSRPTLHVVADPTARPLSDAQAKEIDDLVRKGEKIQALRLHREITGLGLNESKYYIDQRIQEMGYGRPGLTTIVPAGEGAVSRGEFNELVGAVNTLAANLQKLFTGATQGLVENPISLATQMEAAAANLSKDSVVIVHGDTCGGHGEIAKPKDERPATPWEPDTTDEPPQVAPPVVHAGRELKPLDQVTPLESPFVEPTPEPMPTAPATPGLKAGIGDWMNTVQMFKFLGGGDDPRNDNSVVQFRGKALKYKSFRQQTPEHFRDGGLEVDLARKERDEPWLRIKDREKLGLA